jgi:beta-aspartyl-dipeptidase (metallo-type)
MLHLLTNAQVYAPEPLGRKNILVAAGRIAWIGDHLPEIDRELGVQEHDLAGQRLIPGIIDSHAHVIGGGGESGYSSRVPPLALTRFTRNGITTVVGVLGTDDTTRHTADLLAKTRGLCEAGMSAYCHTGGYHIPPVTVTGSVRGDLVHIDRIIGIGEVAISDHRSSQPTLEEILRLAAHAHVAGLMTGKAGILHLHVGDGERGLELVRRALDTTELPARVFNPTHVNRRKALFDEALELAERGCTVDITACPVEEDEDAWSAERAVLRYLEAGLAPDRITLSSDGGGCLPIYNEACELLRMGTGDPGALVEALRNLLRGGAPLEMVLPAFTANVASLLRLPAKGVVVQGADADLVVLDDDDRVRDVMALGRWHIRDGKPTLFDGFEQGR